ncbi:MAG: hypothetical protein OEM77_05675 [Nitrosopumilus sp.]|nr:hypothetical protein [Nitrosopumilus sp.]MDH3735425.1 hypothetical protein [Nitrosopumilus sp.]MDH3823270.1 hypothetical protein [Nitrosopumilus sp.]MDH3832541.1 hypothetical protein [Nitrosopumilus sp.]
MARTYIAFIECVFDDTKTTKWHSESGLKKKPKTNPRKVAGSAGPKQKKKTTRRR